MKYKDKQSIAWQRREIEKSYNTEVFGDINDRKARRKRKRDIANFGVKVCKHVDKIWWISLDETNQGKAYNSWLYAMRFDNSEESFKRWAKNIQKEIKPNKSLFRENKLSEILKGE